MKVAGYELYLRILPRKNNEFSSDYKITPDFDIYNSVEGTIEFSEEIYIPNKFYIRMGGSIKAYSYMVMECFPQPLTFQT